MCITTFAVYAANCFGGRPNLCFGGKSANGYTDGLPHGSFIKPGGDEHMRRSGISCGAGGADGNADPLGTEPGHELLCIQPGKTEIDDPGQPLGRAGIDVYRVDLLM